MRRADLVKTENNAGNGGRTPGSNLLYQLVGVLGISVAVVGYLEVLYHPGKYRDLGFSIPGQYEDEKVDDDTGTTERDYYEDNRIANNNNNRARLLRGQS